MNSQAIVDAILATKVGALAAEEGERLVQAFVDALPRYPDSAWETVAVETPFFMSLGDGKVVIVGVQDRIARDPEGQLWGCEWKSKGEPRLKKDGTPYKGDTEQDWLDQISSDVQLRIYALAQQRARFISSDGAVLQPLVAAPRILVRAVVKARPAYLWPTVPERGQFIFPQAWLDATERALLAAAEQIRGARRSGMVPWALPSTHCTNRYGRLCGFHAPFCAKGQHPTGAVSTSGDNSDPGWKALDASGVDLADPEVVVLSASSYGNWLQCGEQYRIGVGGLGPREESEALEVGTAMHAGIAEVWRGAQGAAPKHSWR